MLTEVKKEVDIMVTSPIARRVFVTLTDGPKRILKGHPNIVHLIDAAWNKTSDGVYEVFILMEYCPGSLDSIVSADPLTIRQAAGSST